MIRSILSCSGERTPQSSRATTAGGHCRPRPATGTAWDVDSTYIARPPFFDGVTLEPAPVADIVGARVLAVLGDSVTTDHISPAGSIARRSPAGQWLEEHGVPPLDFNSYGARRGHHEVMLRGTFGNIRLRNQLADGHEGPYTVHLPDGEEQFIYDAAMRYREAGVPLIVIAGREYGSGSSRDWAAKGTALLGVRAVIAESYERIHRSNLVGMGVLPLEFLPGESVGSIGLTGRESFTVEGVAASLAPRCRLIVVARSDDESSQARFRGRCPPRWPDRRRLLPTGGHLACRPPPSRDTKLSGSLFSRVRSRGRAEGRLRASTG